MRQKKLVIGLLVMLAVLVSGFTYAYWAAGIAADSDTGIETITVGTGETVTSTVTLGSASISSGTLVPAGFAVGGDVTSVTLTWTTSWASTGLDASGLTSTMTVALVSVENPSSADVSDLFNVSLNNGGSYTIISDGANVTVIATITMDEPADYAEYASVAGLEIDFTFSFSVAASTTAA